MSKDTMTPATPRPWTVGMAGNIMSPTNEIVAVVHSYHTGSGEVAANAALIVQAVNSHDALVEALEHIAEQTTKWMVVDTPSKDVAECLARYARAALTLAKEEKR